MDEKYCYPLSLNLFCRRRGKDFQPFFDTSGGFTELANRIIRPVFNKAEVVNGNITMSFSASNGIQWMHLYATVTKRDEVYSLAKVLYKEPNYYADN